MLRLIYFLYPPHSVAPAHASQNVLCNPVCQCVSPLSVSCMLFGGLLIEDRRSFCPCTIYILSVYLSMILRIGFTTKSNKLCCCCCCVGGYSFMGVKKVSHCSLNNCLLFLPDYPINTYWITNGCSSCGLELIFLIVYQCDYVIGFFFVYYSFFVPLAPWKGLKIT